MMEKTASTSVKPLLALAALSLLTITLAALRPSLPPPSDCMLWI